MVCSPSLLQHAYIKDVPEKSMYASLMVSCGCMTRGAFPASKVPVGVGTTSYRCSSHAPAVPMIY